MAKANGQIPLGSKVGMVKGLEHCWPFKKRVKEEVKS